MLIFWLLFEYFNKNKRVTVLKGIFCGKFDSLNYNNFFRYQDIIFILNKLEILIIYKIILDFYKLKCFS